VVLTTTTTQKGRQLSENHRFTGGFARICMDEGERPKNTRTSLTTHASEVDMVEQIDEILLPVTRETEYGLTTPFPYLLHPDKKPAELSAYYSRLKITVKFKRLGLEEVTID
jgi:hypothetical protein